MSNVIPFKQSEKQKFQEDSLIEHRVTTLTAALVLLLKKQGLQNFRFSSEEFFSVIQETEKLKTGFCEEDLVVGFIEKK